MSQQTNDPPSRICICSNDAVCHCTIEVLRDLRMQALQLASQEDVSDGRLRFFPRESLLREISPAFVGKVLQKVSNTNDDIAEGLQQATNRVCPRSECYCKKSLCTGNRVIFASLLFIGLHGILGRFLHAAQLKYCDNSIWRLSQKDMKFDDGDQIFQDIEKLGGAQKQLFLYWTHRIGALCFLKKGPDDKVKPLALEDGVDDRMRLPWTSIERPTRPSIRQSSRASQESRVVKLPSAEVQKVCIHRSHHTLDETSNEFALKTFHGSDLGPSFAQELDINNTISHSDRILSLLAAFEYRSTFYLLFPWAELGDLGKIWREYSTQPNGATGQRFRRATWYSPQWLLGECHGIASAVAEIHGLKDSAPGKFCIFHTDIKPDNILAFYDSQQDRVLLKLADFGHSCLMETTSSYISGSRIPNALSYRAPEYDTQKGVTIKYDVWSLGCVFLEFVTWALQGWDKVAEFTQKRLDEEKDPKVNHPNFAEDTFFERVAGHRGPFSWSKLHHALKPRTNTYDRKENFAREISFTLPVLNRSVVTQVRETVLTHIKGLNSTAQPEHGIQQLVEMIQNRMLVTDYERRASSGEVRDRASDISKEIRTREKPH